MIQASSWIIDGLPAGLAFREGKASENFGDMSPFLLHTVKRDSSAKAYNFIQTDEQKKIHDSLYNKDPTENPTNIYNKNDIKVNTN